MNFPHSPLFASSLVVGHNAVKNILFRAATIILDYVILRVFAFIAFQCRDYTSFLIFAEDFVQKALFVFSRGFRRQALLVAMFIVFVAAVGFYDTLLWGLDDPGYVLRRRVVDGETLASQMVDSPAYLNYISANLTHPSTENTLNTTFNANLYAPGVNFTLPGIFNKGLTEVVPPLHPLSPYPNGTARIWLDDGGFAVGLDPGYMWVDDMLSNQSSTAGMCYPSNPLGEKVTQTWRCTVPDRDGLALFSNTHGQVSIWWDEVHSEFLMPQRTDNPWKSLGAGGGTSMMKQVFTVTKGHRRHTFLSTVLKATMLAFRPKILDDAEITDFMRRTWSNGTTTPAVTTLTNFILYAKGNDTGTTFGAFTQWNTSVGSTSTELINIRDGGNDTLYTALRFSITNITLIRSEILYNAPTPLEPCPGLAYRNLATGGIVRSTNCKSTSPEKVDAGATLFLGQVDTSAVTIINDFLGDGTSNLSSVALTDSGLSWLIANEKKMDELLTSRALLLGGNRADVTVYIEYSVPAISILQLILCVLPIALAILAHFLTRREVMSYFKGSFLAAVLATTHVSTSSSCEKLGYLHSMPEISLQRDGRHVILGTPGGGSIAHTTLEPRELVYEPFMPAKDEQLEMLAPHHHQF
ncbi:hypothetical protein D9619_013409 [Psilocybe cf. subviscida]|uniref:Transmembrane protein n=1 Tax=Psilocybe cf. subviscida TaxID=2480587 RepID=A0A8H5F912_9AGAR|nr:hypothetical protein D9619_013409 [Psilocybe cf. subviscida]